MEPSLPIIESLVRKIKDEMFSSVDFYSFVSPSAYDTAWLAMVPDPTAGNDGRPMFGECLNWIVNNQRDGGFWGELDGYGNPTIDCLPATLACMLALKSWGVGSGNVERGRNYHGYLNITTFFSLYDNLFIYFFLGKTHFEVPILLFFSTFRFCTFILRHCILYIENDKLINICGI